MALGVMPWGTKVPLARAMELYEVYRGAGGNVLDTAHIYAAWEEHGQGASERALGEVLRKAGDRRQVIVASKGGHPAEPFYARPERFLSPEVVKRDIRESLERMGIDMIDLYFLHRDDRRVPVDEIIGMMNEEVSEGRIRYFGASNWSIARMAEANAYATRSKEGLMGLVASQPEFSLAQVNGEAPTGDPALRWLTEEDAAWHEQTGMPAFCYSPTAKGYFASGGTRGAERFENAVSRGRLARATELAGKLGVAPNQVALAWVLAQRFRAIPILGTGDVKHLREGLESERIALTQDQVKWLRDG
jgi:aryl-alcohol dehydrogenase-like predicted oxidoreductase